MMNTINGFSSDSVSASRGKSLVFAEALERAIRSATSALFSYDIAQVTYKILTVVRKLAHIAEYFILASLLFCFAECVTGKQKKKLAVILSALFAFFDELHQGFVPGRWPSLFDVSIDTLGAILAVVVLSEFMKNKKALDE